MKPLYTQDVSAVARDLGVDPDCGLEDAEAQRRLVRYGPNLIPQSPGPGVLGILGRQFLDATVLVLLAAAVAAGLIGEGKDTAIILVIVAINAAIATVQEVRARAAIAALRKLGAAKALVVRNAIRQTIDAEGLVPGDVVVLEAGAIVPADLRLTEAARLAIEESMLTGESLAVHKQTEALGAQDLPLGDRTPMAFKGTTVATGRGRGIVVATGSNTELGALSRLTEAAADSETPLQRRLQGLGRTLSIGVIVICALLFVAGLARGEPVALMFLTAVSLAVAAIPEALPATLAIALALGARRMSEGNALARRLAAVEALGSVTTICTDKTGTLTLDRMHAETIVLADGTPLDAIPVDDPRRQALLTALAVNNDVLEGRDGKPQGDATEIAAVCAAAAEGFHRRDLLQRLPRVFELPFEPERKRMTTVHAESDHCWLGFTKGAPEAVIPLCRHGVHSQEALAVARVLAERGLRVLAVAKRRFAEPPVGESAETIETDLELLGFIGMIDPPRPEAEAAVAACRSAGIVAVMITGDHPDTALAIARRLGIADHMAQVVAGPALARMSDDELRERLDRLRVFARVDPAQKIRIVEALKGQGQFVAMTGDGVNDAPALRKADIGVAMGRTGTDVAREAADLVLLDDNFASIVTAVREGRRIYDNIRKFMRFMLTGNSAEIWTMAAAPFLGLAVPLLPIHILWINLVTDSLPALALAAEPAEGDVMRRPPRPPTEGILAAGLWQHALWVGLLMGASALAALKLAGREDVAQTMVFTVLTFAQLLHVLVVRSDRRGLFASGFFANPALIASVVGVMALQLAVIYLPFLNGLLDTRPLSGNELLTCIALAMIAPAAAEIDKWLRKR